METIKEIENERYCNYTNNECKLTVHVYSQLTRIMVVRETPNYYDLL